MIKRQELVKVIMSEQLIDRRTNKEKLYLKWQEKINIDGIEVAGDS
jgi:hypothetical protein